MIAGVLSSEDRVRTDFRGRCSEAGKGRTNATIFASETRFSTISAVLGWDWKGMLGNRMLLGVQPQLLVVYTVFGSQELVGRRRMK